MTIQEKIQNKLDEATNYACTLIRQGTPAPIAFRQAAKYYNQDEKAINRAVSQRGAQARAKRKASNFNHFSKKM